MQFSSRMSVTKWPPSLSDITNGLVIEIFDYKDRHSELTDRLAYGWVRDMYGDSWPDIPPTIQALKRSVIRLRGRLSTLKKQRNSAIKDTEIQKFLQSTFQLPSLALQHGRVVQFSPPRKRPTATSSAFGANPATVTLQSGNDAKEMNKVKKQMYAITRNANKRLKRREVLIDQLKETIRNQKETIKRFEEYADSTKKKLSFLRSKLDRVNHKATYWRGKLDTVTKDSSKKRKELSYEAKLLKEKIASLDLSFAEASEGLQSLLASEEITTFENGKYTNDIRACIYELLSLNVGVRNISPIIKCVLKNVVHKKAQRLPSYGLTCSMILESLAVLQAQLGQELSDFDGFSTLQTDGTTKFGNKYAAYDVRVPETNATFALGLRHVFSGSASDTLDTFKEILDDIDAVQCQIGESPVSNAIILKIKNTMSDRHSAEKLFKNILEDFRAEVLPTVAENWDEMTIDEKEQLTRMNGFFCGLHYLVGLADSAEETLRLWEAQTRDENPPSVSGTQRLVRTACKLFHHRGSQQCGYSVQFRTYLRKIGIHKVPLAQFVGNRFNILFYDAAGVYYLQTHMLDFIKTVHGNQANRLAKAVGNDLQEPMYLAGCRALGLVDKIITGPLWRKLQESSMSVLKMSEVYSNISEKFDQWSLNAQGVVEGTALLQDDMVVHYDEVFEELRKSDDDVVADSSATGMTLELLQLLCQAFSVCTKRLLSDHLPGGEFNSLMNDTRMLSETASVPTTNVAPEINFALLDRFLREKPNANLVALEAMILYSHNQSSSWLEQQTAERREKLFKAARTLAPLICSKFKARHEELQAKQLNSLVKKQKELAKKQMQAMIEKENLTIEIGKIGFWKTLMEVEAGLEHYRTKAEKKKVLKVQLQFRQKVICQAYAEKSVFKFSQNGKQYSVQQLKENLCKLLEASAETQNSADTIDYEMSQCLSLDEVLADPSSLVGHKVNHRFEDDSGELNWYEGAVVGYDRETLEFTVVYNDDDEEFRFNLIEDIEHSDLLITSELILKRISTDFSFVNN